MTDKEKFMIWLAGFNLTEKKFNEIVKLCNGVYDIFAFGSIRGLDRVLKYEEVDAMRQMASPMAVQTYFDTLEKLNVKVLVKGLAGYPEKLAVLPDAPVALFCKGDVSLLQKFSIAIVGSRSPSNYGRIVTDEFASEIARSGAVVVSGLAYGVDSIAHEKTLEIGGKTIAVLGSGFNYIYPAEHTQLANEIAQKGLLISEYSPSFKATKYTFVARNRIIAGLCDGLLITEGSLSSGTRSTKDFALNYGKDVYAIPGSIKSSASDLPNKLIACGHAKCVLSAKDILEEYNLKSVKKVEVRQTSAQEDIILNLLADGEKDVAYLQENSGFDIKNLNSYLTLLEIRGIIRKLPGNFYAVV